MSGFVRKTLRLEFADPELDGFEVRARRLSIDQLLGINNLRRLSGMKDDDPEVREALNAVFVALAGDEETPGILLDWNLEEPKDRKDPDSPTVPVPLTAATLRAQDMGLVMSIVDAIQDATTAVPADLKATSSAGDQSVELSLPMEPLSESQTS